jgi:HAD superfamily hydrolase (TIGR01509 family)
MAAAHQTGLASLFDPVITMGDVQFAKPAPDLFLQAARSISVEPTAGLAFEDSDTGIESAQSAGMYCVDVRDRKRTRHWLSLLQAA